MGSATQRQPPFALGALGSGVGSRVRAESTSTGVKSGLKAELEDAVIVWDGGDSYVLRQNSNREK